MVAEAELAGGGTVRGGEQVEGETFKVGEIKAVQVTLGDGVGGGKFVDEGQEGVEGFGEIGEVLQKDIGRNGEDVPDETLQQRFDQLSRRFDP